MEFNIEKCKVMNVGQSNPRYKYFMNGVELTVTDEERDLEVWMESTLKPTLQCAKAAGNANRVLGMILKTFHYKRKQSLIPLYKSLVRPKMELGVAA